MQHAADYLVLLQRLLREENWPAASLTHVFVSVGPGSFTGLRIGVTIARTLSWSLCTQVVAVPTLDTLARNALTVENRPEHVAVLLDAKREQVYAGAYRVGELDCTPISGPTLAYPAEFLRSLPRPLAVLGEGIPYHRAAIEHVGVQILPDESWRPHAAQVLTIGSAKAQRGEFTLGPDLLPLYIRRPEAEEKWDKLHPPIPGNSAPNGG
jgi:tRNA threonylcarbamoyladenosine biosynthesis protein TsaB